MRPSERLRRDAGQASVMVVTLLFVLILMVALVVNVGQIVNRRVGLQLVADGGAWTGATAMAVQLNAMARLNLEIQQDWVALTQATQGFSVQTIGPGLQRYPVCPVSDAGVAIYTAQRAVLGRKFTRINSAVEKPLEEAKYVSAFNARDLFPREQLDYWDVRTGSGGNGAHGRDGTELWPVEQVPDGTQPVPPGALSGSVRSATWQCVMPGIPPHLESRSAQFDVWYRKKPGSDTQYFAFFSRLGSSRWLMYDDIFGAMSGLVAAAAAKPIGGSIEGGDPSYVTKMVELSRVIDGGWYVDPVTNRRMKVVH